MNNKLMATMAIILLLIGTFSMVMSIAPVTAVDTYCCLTIGYDPCPGMPEPDTAPTVGDHDYTIDSVINVTAPLIVDDTTGVQWSFLKWMVFYPDGSNATAASNKFTVTMNENKTAIAYYKIQYYLDVVSPFGTPWGAGWFDEYTMHWAGLDVGVVTLGSMHKAWFINWTGDGSGTNYISIDSAINMTGPKTVVANWVEKYYLYTDSSYYPWGSGYDPDKEGYKPKCTYVDLTAPTYDSVNPNHWRWRFDRWEIEKWNYTSGAWELAYTEITENITVHIDAPITATVYFHLQYYLTVTDSPSAIDSGVESQSDYYDFCSNVTLIAPEYVPDPSDPWARWVFKQWYIAGVIDWYNTTLTVHIGAGWDKTAIAIYTKEYHLIVQDNIGDLSGVSVQGCKWYTPSTVVDPLWAPCIVPVDSGTRYVFVEWVKDPGHYTDSNCNTTITMSGPRNATAYYKKQYKGTWTADPDKLNAKISGWPGEAWYDANKKYWWSAPSGPIADYPFDYYFDHWTLNGIPQTQYINSLQINFTEPINGVAEYLGKSAFFITPQTVIKDVPAECTTFTVNVTAANLVDLYAFDFKVTWDPTLLNLTAVDVEVNEIWTQYFIAKNEWNNTEGWYWLVATSLDDYGFNGTHKIVALTFHIIYDPCYLSIDYFRETKLELTVNQLANSKGYPICPWNVHGSYYRINAIQPTLKMSPEKITMSEKDATFTVDIEIVNAIKLHSFVTFIGFDNTIIKVIDVQIYEDFLHGPYEYKGYWNNPNNDWNGLHYYDSWGIGAYLYVGIFQADGVTPVSGNGTLATITFQVINSIFWTTSDPKLTTTIKFHDWLYDGAVWFRGTYIDVLCPDYNEIYPPTLGIVNAEYTYDPIPGDLNMDGAVNVLDLQLVAADYGSSTTYDLNNDGKVDLLDLVLVAINYGRDKP